MRKIFFISAACLMFSACKDGAAEEKETAPQEAQTITLDDAQKKNAGIGTDSVRLQAISTVIKVHGKVEAPPQNIISVSAKLGGFVKSTTLLPGMKVKKGDVLAVMEDQEYINLQQEYLSSKAKLSYAEKEYERQKELNESKSSSDKVLQAAESEYTGQRVMVASLSERLKLLGIDPSRLNEDNLSRTLPVYSPITGYVTRVNVNVGKFVSSADVLFELVDPADIHLALTVFEKDIDRIKVGQQVKAYTNNSAKNHHCEVILLGKSLTAERSLEIHCHFKEYDPDLLPGMYMNAEILSSSEKVRALPEAAVVRFEGRSYVFSDEGRGSYRITEVQTGFSSDGFTEIKNADDLKNKEIVIAGAYSLLMGMKNKAE